MLIPINERFLPDIVTFISAWVVGVFALMVTQFLAEWVLALFSIASDLNIIRRNAATVSKAPTESQEATDPSA